MAGEKKTKTKKNGLCFAHQLFSRAVQPFESIWIQGVIYNVTSALRVSHFQELLMLFGRRSWTSPCCKPSLLLSHSIRLGMLQSLSLHILHISFGIYAPIVHVFVMKNGSNSFLKMVKLSTFITCFNRNFVTLREVSRSHNVQHPNSEVALLWVGGMTFCSHLLYSWSSSLNYSAIHDFMTMTRLLSSPPLAKLNFQHF